jgi:hypothetical protein
MPSRKIHLASWNASVSRKSGRLHCYRSLRLWKMPVIKLRGVPLGSGFSGSGTPQQQQAGAENDPGLTGH